MNKTRNAWMIIKEVFGHLIEKEANVEFSQLESAVIEESFLAYHKWGTLHEISYEDEIIDWTVAENILAELCIPDHYEEETNIPGYEDGAWLSYWISELVWQLRRTFHRMFGNIRIVTHNGNLADTVLDQCKALHYLEDDSWRLHVNLEVIDSGYIAAPTLSEFRTLMFHWQENHGNVVGQQRNYEGCNGVYIGRNREVYDNRGISGIQNTDVPMGNPFSAKAHRTYNLVTEAGPMDVYVKDKLSACYAFYLNKVNRLILYGLDDGDDHWTHLIDLQDHDLICHCGDFTNQRNEKKFCHGLVLAALADWLNPYVV